jgi:hypothetical protein
VSGKGNRYYTRWWQNSESKGLVGFLQIFYSQAIIPRTIVDSPTFLEHGSAEKIAVCAHTTRDPNK